VKDLEPIVNQDRLVFAEIAQTIFALPPNVGVSAAPVLAAIKKQCEERIIAIDSALGDV